MYRSSPHCPPLSASAFPTSAFAVCSVLLAGGAGVPALAQSGDASITRLEYESAFDAAIAAGAESTDTVMPDAEAAPAPGDGADAPDAMPDGRLSSAPAASDGRTAEARDATADGTATMLDYDSAFDDYDAYEEIDAPRWIEANRVVGEKGGWQAYARDLYMAIKAKEEAEMEAMDERDTPSAQQR